ncbi:hypothetical protein Micbo1qcDRAFT_6750 [Microdochium bolleyi]|uniref:Uncharacterized protein n=1 Tax=Microdochium bolleyi TaxID=196109 RepID=A0A136JJD7_9PEZI|nr:hypothetical protein Micbo1qcDRAFT_6750 [Microdochium bolleyi]
MVKDVREWRWVAWMSERARARFVSSFPLIVARLTWQERTCHGNDGTAPSSIRAFLAQAKLRHAQIELERRSFNDTRGPL